MTNVYPKPELGKPCPGTNGEIVIAWGHVEAVVDDKEYDRWCILTLLPELLRAPNEENYAVIYLYPGELPPNTQRHESRAHFPNIVPAVEYYIQMGMDW